MSRPSGVDQDIFDVYTHRHGLTGTAVANLLEVLQETRDILRAVWDNAERNETLFDEDINLNPDTRLDLQGLPLVKK